jgi:hypothetical protein
MRILSWNLNHRAGVRAIPDWLVPAIEAESPDVLVCTAYVRGPRHVELLAAFRAMGLRHSDVTAPQAGGANCVLLAARESLLGGPVRTPEGSPPSVEAGFLHAILEESGVHVFGFRMPDFGKMLTEKRHTFDWLTEAIEPYLQEPTLVIGDFNTAPGDSRRFCGDRLETLMQRGWRLAIPVDGASFYTPSGHPRRIDLAFVSPLLSVMSTEYSWRFQDLSPDATRRRAGILDHAMLLLDVQRASSAR